MSEFQTFSKSESLEFIRLFEANTTTLEKPMIGFYGDGAMSLEEATKLIEDGLEHKGISICAKRPDEEYWESIFIHKDEDDDYLVTTGDMSSLSDKYSPNISDALKLAEIMMLSVISNEKED